MVDEVLFCQDCDGEGVNERGYICKKCRGTGLVRVEADTGGEECL